LPPSVHDATGSRAYDSRDPNHSRPPR
jgi:hypothetical protein